PLHLVGHQAHRLHDVGRRPPSRVNPRLSFAQLRRLQPRDPGAARLGTGGPIVRRQARFWFRQGQHVETQAARHRVDRDDLSDDAHGLDILLVAETASNDTAKPWLAETAGVGPYPMDEFDHDFGQSAEAVVLALAGSRRQRLLALAAE